MAIDNSTSMKTTEFLLVYFQGPICIFGFGLNLINFSVFVRKKYFAAPYVLLSALSLADALTLLLYSTETIAKCEYLSICKQPYVKVSAYVFVLYVKVPISNITETISCIITMAMATERYIAMRHYNFRKVYCTVKNTRLLVLSISVFATIFNTPFFFTTKIRINMEFTDDFVEKVPVVYSNYTSLMNSRLYSGHSWVRAVAIQILPLVYLCICNSMLLTLICQHNKRLESLRTSSSISSNYRSLPQVPGDSPSAMPHTPPSSARDRKQMAQNKLTILLSTVICLYLIGQIPSAFAYMKIYKRFNTCSSFEFIHECPNYDMYRTVTLLMMLSSYSLNFVVYFFLNSHFRKSLRTCVGQCIPNKIQAQMPQEKSVICNNNLMTKHHHNHSMVFPSAQTDDIISLTLPNPKSRAINDGSKHLANILTPITELSKEDASTSLLDTFEIESVNIQSNVYMEMLLLGKRYASNSGPLLGPLATPETTSFESINDLDLV